MAKYESQIKQVPYSQSAVYSKVSDLTHLAAIKERINDPKVQEQIPADKLEEVKKSLEQMECTTDTLSTPVGPIGNISVKNNLFYEQSVKNYSCKIDNAEDVTLEGNSTYFGENKVGYNFASVASTTQNIIQKDNSVKGALK